MKQTEQILSSCERQNSLVSSNQEVSNNEMLSNQFMYDQQALRDQIKEKYKEHLQRINNHPQSVNFCFDLIKQFITFIFAFLQQLWIQVIPQCIRGRYFAEKSPRIMQKYSLLNCGNMSLFLSRMKSQSKYFFIILQQRIREKECFDIEETLFDNSEESNKKLNYILQCQTVSLNTEDLGTLQRNQNSPLRLSHFLKFNTKCPLLLVCRYNFLQELKVMGQIELSFLSKESFIELLDEIKKNIFELKNLESECKRQVLMELLQVPRDNFPIR